MSTMTEVAGTTTTNHYFDPSQEQSTTKLAQGVYPANIIKCVTIVKPIKGKYKARIFNYRVKVHQSVATRHYQVEDIDGAMKDVDASGYIGREIRSSGVFFFLTPEAGDDFEANPGGNDKYLRFCESIGIDCPEIEVEIDGEKRMVKTLPELEPSDIIGKPLMSYIDLSPWKDKEGNQRSSMNVKNFDKWSDGSTRDIGLEDLPF